MKRFYLLLATLFTLNGASAQPCLPDGITFSTQAQVNNFAITYPHCSEIGGSVTINGYNITNLFGLSNLNHIGGSLYIECNQLLPNLHGLENLAYVGGDFSCLSNIALTSLNGLNGLTYIGGDITITNNKYLASMDGMQGLSSINGTLWINDNDALVSLTGMNNVASVAGLVRICSNPELVSLSGLDGLTTIGGNLLIGGQDHLGGLGNPSLLSLGALMNLVSVGGKIEIGYNASLGSLGGIDNIAPATISELSVYSNDTLSSCDVASVCSILAAPGSIVYISDNAAGCNTTEEVAEECLTSGIPGRVAKPAVSVYPNPASVQVTVELIELPHQNRFVLLNLVGKEVFSMQLSERKTVIDVSGLPTGIYFIKVTASGMVKTGKLIRQ